MKQPERAVVVRVGPFQALAWLASGYGIHHDQRPLEPERVRAILDALKSGQLQGSSSVTFHPDGCLDNGQHRLAAIAIAGQTFWLPVEAS